MADVEVDPEKTNPLGEGTSNMGDDDGESFRMEGRETSSRRGSKDITNPLHGKTTAETSFIIGIDDENSPLIQEEISRGEESLRDKKRGKDEAEIRIREKFPRAKFTNPTVFARIDEYGQIMVKLGGKGKRE